MVKYKFEKTALNKFTMIETLSKMLKRNDKNLQCKEIQLILSGKNEWITNFYLTLENLK